MNDHEQHLNYKILSEIEGGKLVSQRSLSRELGIALGLTNLLIKRLVNKGYVKTSSAIRGKRLQYLLTRKGIAEKSRLTIASMENTIRLYTETREKIRISLDKLVRSDDNSDSPQRIVFYGAGDVAEIAYITLNNSVFELVGVVDDHRNGQEFFGHRIGSPEDLADGARYREFDHLVVTTFRGSREIRVRLKSLKVPSQKVAFL